MIFTTFVYLLSLPYVVTVSQQLSLRLIYNKEFTSCELIKIAVIFVKVHLIKRQSIEAFAKANARSRVSFTIWLTAVKYADWNQAADIQLTFGAADLLGKGTSRVVFDIGGNNYRMICKYAFGQKVVHLFVCWIGTHAEYDKLCNDNKQFTVNIY